MTDHPLMLKNQYMDKTLQMITESIIKQIKPNITDDVDLSELWIDDMVDDSRAALVPSLYNANDTFSGWYQDMVLEATRDTTIIISGYQYRYKTPLNILTLPGLLMESMGWKNILYLGSYGIEGKNIQRVTMSEFQEYENHRYGGMMPCYVVDGLKIYMKNIGIQKHFRATMCFAKPTCVPLYTRDASDYPIPLSLHRKLEIVIFQHIAPKLNLPIDVISNNSDETRTGSMQEALKQSEKE